MALEPCLTSLLDTSPTSPTKGNSKSVILAVYCLLDVAHIGEGVRCKLHDGVHIIPAIITSEALNAYQTKRNMRWESLRRSRLVLKSYELKPCVEGLFNPFLLISDFDSHGYPMKDKTDNLRDIKPTDKWKSRCRGAAFQLFDKFPSEDFLNNADFPNTLTVWEEPRSFSKTFPGGSCTNNTNNQASAQCESTTEDDSWQATPMPYINVEDSQNSQRLSSQVTAAVEESWGETPVSYIKQQDDSERTRIKAQVPLTQGSPGGQGPSHHASHKSTNQCSVNTSLSLSTSSESEPEISQFPSPEDDIECICLSPTVKNWVTNNLDSPSLENLVLKRKNPVPDTSLITGCVLSTPNHVIDNNTRNAAASPITGVISSLSTCDKVTNMGTVQTNTNLTRNTNKSSKMAFHTGCKHDPAKKCISCFLREPIIIPDYLFNQAKKNGFRCQCKT